MNSELTFLVDLLLNYRMPKATRDAIVVRVNQTIGHLNAMGAEKATVNAVKPKVEAITPAPIVGQTPTAQAALAQRQALINAAVNKKVMPGTDHAPKAHARP
jgi:hypothetical protein